MGIFAKHVVRLTTSAVASGPINVIGCAVVDVLTVTVRAWQSAKPIGFEDIDMMVMCT